MGIFGKSKKERINDLMEEGLNELKNYQYDKRNYVWAGSKFSEVLKLDPKNQTALFNLGKSLAGEEKYKEAIECFDKAIQIKPDSEIWWCKGDSLRKSGKRNEEALNSFKKAYELNPDEPKITWSIIYYYIHREEFDHAITLVDRYLSSHPDDIWAWCNKGVILEKLEKYENALECYTKAKSFYDEDNTAIYIIDTYEAGYVRVCNKILLKKDFNNILPLNKSEFIIDKCLCSIVSNYLLNGDADGVTEVLDVYDEELCPFSLDHEVGDQIIVLTTENLYFIYNGDPTIENIEWEPVEKFKISWEMEWRISWEMEWREGSYSILALCMDHDIFAFENTKKSHQFANSLSEAVSKKRVKNKLHPPKNPNAIIDFSSIKEYLKNGGVVMQTFKCPGCGAALEFPDNVDVTNCKYCGNKIKAVDLFEKIRTLI